MSDTQNNLGSTVDKLYELRAKRLQLEKQAQELKTKETNLQTILIEACNKQSLLGARGNIGSISLKPTTVPTVGDWGKVEEYILDTGFFHLMQRRISSAAYIEHLGLRGQIPGIESTTLTKLSLTRAKT